MGTRDYENGAANSSSGSKDNFRKGSPDTRDMYDFMPQFTVGKVDMVPNGGIQGTPKSSTGSKDKDMPMAKNDGSKDYGKGNPYKKTKITSIEQLRAIAKTKGA